MRIASERPQPLIILSVCVRVPLSLLHSRCYDAQHLKSGLLTAPLLRHLHGHCVVCYTVQCWLVFVMIIPVDERRRLTLVFFISCAPCYFDKTISSTVPDLRRQISFSLYVTSHYFRSSSRRTYVDSVSEFCGNLGCFISGRHCVGNI